MAKNWSQYQHNAAGFFRSLGLTAEVEKRIAGTRGAHEIDVWVTGNIQGFDAKWIVECKDWSSNVPKEKVLALYAIIQDVGADRGFLLSETGFQAGAIPSASHTNITLTSLADLREQTRDYLTQARLSALYLKVSDTISEFHSWAFVTTSRSRNESMGSSRPGSLEQLGKLAHLESAIFEAIRNRYPVVASLTEVEQAVRGA